MSLIVWSIIVAIVVVVAVLIFRAINHRYFDGLDHPDITDDDIVNVIRRATSATNILENIIEPVGQCPDTQAEVNRQLQEQGVYTAGQALVGVVNEGVNTAYMEKNTRKIQAYRGKMRNMRKELFPVKADMPEMQEKRKTG